MSSPLFWVEQTATGLYAVHDDRGPVLGYEDIETRGEAYDHCADLAAALNEEAAMQADFDAAAPALLIDLNAILVEAA